MDNKLFPGADVWFHAGVHELQLLSDQPLAAKVTYVTHAGLVNLIVWGKSGSTYQRPGVPFWDDDGDAPTGNYATWPNADDFDLLDAPAKSDVTHHPFEGRPSGGTEDLDRAREAQAALDARGNIDHGPPRGAPSPFSGGPLTVDDHKPTPTEPGPVAKQYYGADDPKREEGESDDAYEARVEAERKAAADRWESQHAASQKSSSHNG